MSPAQDPLEELARLAAAAGATVRGEGRYFRVRYADGNEGLYLNNVDGIDSALAHLERLAKPQGKQPNK